MSKKEEEKSYVVLYVALSFVLATTNVWAFWNEIVGKRPWKEYQNRFYEMEYEDAKRRYEEAESALGQPDKQSDYRAIEKKLEEAREEFERPSTQYKYKKALEELRSLDKNELAPLKFESMVTRNKMLEEEYLYGKYKREKSREKLEESKKRIDALDKKTNELAEEIKHIEEKRTRLQKGIDGFKSKVTKHTKELESHSSDMLKYKEAMEKLRSRRPQLQAYQVHLGELNEVDRCMSCHVGINRKESISSEQPYSSHPGREVYLGNHPTERFGCVLCHEGQARATTSAKKAHGEVEYWLKPMLRGKTAQSSCVKCHDKAEYLDGGEEIRKGIRLFEELGCFGCHPTEGFGGDDSRMIGPDLTDIASKVNPSWLVSWLQGPENFRPGTRMPDFKLEKEEAESIAAYIWRNSNGDMSIGNEERERGFNGEMIEEGRYIFEDVGCLACHSDVEGEGSTHGPNLARIGEKISYEYLVSWLLAPERHQPKTRMPNFRLNEEDARLLAAYLMSLKSDGYEEPVEAAGWLDDIRTAERGEKLVSRYGCYGCHKIKGMEGKTRIGTGLSEVGSKDIHLFDFGILEKKILHEAGLKNSHENIAEARRAWLKAKLTDPRQFDQGRYKRPEDRLRMPDFNLTEDEVGAITILLTGMREEKISDNYVYEVTEKQRFLAEGRRVAENYNCMGCHQFTIDKLYLSNGAQIRGMIKLEEEDSLFFQLWEDNEELGRKAGETTQIMKDEIKSIKRAEGGDIASFIIDYHVEAEGRLPEEAKVFTPPMLEREGKKTQAAWLFKFLNKPVILRPWLNVRMPTFNFQNDDVTSLIRYFATMDGQEYPYEFLKETDEGYMEEKEREKPGYLARARSLFESKDINCASCHVRGDITPEGDPSDWAPDLSMARERLRPDWIVNWLLNPQLIQPGTKMPGFFRKGVFQDILPGSPEEQAVALKDLLMNLPQDMLTTEEPDKNADKTSKSLAETIESS